MKKVVTQFQTEKLKVTSPASVHVNTVHNRGVSLSLPVDYANLI